MGISKNAEKCAYSRYQKCRYSRYRALKSFSKIGGPERNCQGSSHLPHSQANLLAQLFINPRNLCFHHLHVILQNIETEGKYEFHFRESKMRSSFSLGKLRVLLVWLAVLVSKYESS